MLNIKKKKMKDKGLVNSLLWLIGIVIFIKFMYKDISMASLLFGLFFILSIVWFVFSFFQIFYGLRFYLSSQKWSYFTSKQWITYLASVPLLVVTLLLYVNYMK